MFRSTGSTEWIFRAISQLSEEIDVVTLIFFREKQKHSCGSVPENGEEWSAASCTHKFTSLPTEPWGTALETKSNKIAGCCRKPVEEDKGKQEKSPNRNKTTWDLLQVCRAPGRREIWVTWEPASAVLGQCHYKERESKNETGKNLYSNKRQARRKIHFPPERPWHTKNSKYPI